MTTVRPGAFWICFRWGHTSWTVRPFDLRRRESRMTHLNPGVGLTIGVER